MGIGFALWVWVKVKPAGYGPQTVVHVSIYQGKPFGVPIFDPQPLGDGFLLGILGGRHLGGD